MLLFRASSCIFLLLHFFSALSQSTSCHLGDVYLLKQSEIDNFAKDHPGCTSLSGDLVIQEEYDGVILNLEGLSQLKKIGGQLKIIDNKKLSNLKGLDHLDSITIGIEMWRNPSLTSINLSQLLELGSFHIFDNQALQQIDTFLFIDTIESIGLYKTPSLLQLSAFFNLKHCDRFSISENQSLISMEGLSNLQTVEGLLTIENDSNLVSLQGLHQLTRIGTFLLNSNPMLVDLSGLENVSSVTSINFNDNTKLNSIDALNDLVPDNLERIQIKNNPELSYCQIEPICQRFHLTINYPEIEGNGTGCNSPQELIRACGLNTTCPGQVVLHTQSDIDHFAEIYPGCDSIQGDLIIEYSNISTLAGLTQIKYVAGDLILAWNPQLTNLDGLENVKEVGGKISLEGHENLVSISGLHGIQAIKAGFGMYYNYKLKSLSGFMSFDSIQGDVYIGYSDSLADIDIMNDAQFVSGNLTFDNLPSLADLQGLENLRKVSGSLELSRIKIRDLSPLSQLDTVEGKLTIDRCSQLKDLEGLTGLRSIYDLLITNNDSLINVGGLPQILQIPGKLQISDNPQLTSLSGLTALQQVGDAITISGNAELQDLATLQQLTIANGIILKNNPRLEDLSGLQQLQINHGQLIINSMSGLKNLHGLEQLHTIDGWLEISANDSLISLQGLTQLTKIGGHLLVQDNSRLNTMLGIEALDSIGGDFAVDNCGLNAIQIDGLESVGGELSIINNTKLAFVHGFDQLNETHNILIRNNVKLTDLSGFTNLKSLPGYLDISNNGSLISLPEFNLLKEIGSTLNLSSNLNLVDIEFINHIEKTGGIAIKYCRADSLFFTRLKRVEGNFEIANIFDLKGIYADSLLKIDGKFRISDNANLLDLGSFQSLFETGNDFEVSDNGKLENIEALSSLHRFNGRLRITNNNNLLTIEGLRNVDPSSFYVPDSYIYQDVFIIQENNKLSTCAVPPICEILATPDKEYTLRSNGIGCNNKIEVQADCGLANSCLPDSVIFDSQASIDAFPFNYPGCGFVQGSLIIEENTPGDIMYLDSLAQVIQIGGNLVIRNNLQLPELKGLDSLAGLGGSLEIRNNAVLTSLMALQKLPPHENLTEAYIDMDFVISNNPSLNACSIPYVCSALTDPYKSYDLSANLTGCNTVSEIQELCSYPTECECGSQSSQSELENFRIRNPKCIHVTDYITLESYFSTIENLFPLSLIESIDGPLRISSLPQLTSLSGLDQLRKLNGPLVIKSNAQLEDISALSELDASSIKRNFYHLELNDNTQLSECAIESICQLVENSEIVAKISNNGNTCKSREEILMECSVGILTPDENLEILVYPNPAQDEIHIESTADLQSEIISIAITDMNGRVRSISRYTNTVDISHFPPGLYALILKSQHHGLLAHRFIVAR